MEIKMETQKTSEIVSHIMDHIAALHESHGVPQKGNKKYTQVVHRMEAFRKAVGFDYGVTTEIIVDDGQRVVLKATIHDTSGHIIGTGFAEEIRGKGLVNTTSALENAETSAIGRALAALGLSGGEYASANEMDAVERKTEAIAEQKKTTITLLRPKQDPVEVKDADELVKVMIELAKKVSQQEKGTVSQKTNYIQELQAMNEKTLGSLGPDRLMAVKFDFDTIIRTLNQ